MNRIPALARRYPIVAVTALVGLVVVGLMLSDHATAARWLASAFALIIALQTSIGMIKDLLRGHWGIDVLAVMAIVTTVAVGEYLAALVIVLMLSGGRALQDYAAGRAKQELTALLARAPQVAHLMQADTDAVNPVPPLTAHELLVLAASAEQYSSHVLAASVLAAAEARGLSLQKAVTAQEYATHGALAELPEGTVAVGKRSFVGENASGSNQLRCTAASSPYMSR
jgi:cation transport ATPase